MISDEMRELLSAYVDGELRDADAARVEDLSKRDPELRAEIEAYRKLRRKLREWDEAENAIPLPGSFVEKTLARAGGMVAARQAHRRGRLVGLLVPVGMAAALLLAAGAGLLLAGPSAPGAPPGAPRTPFALEPLDPAPDLAVADATLPAESARTRGALVRLDDHLPTRRARELEVVLRREEADGKKAVAEPVRERRSVTPVSAEVLALTDGVVAASAPADSLVALARPVGVPGLPPVAAAGESEGVALDQSEGIIYRELLGDGQAQIAPVGEVWVGTRDESRRTRIVARADWVARREAKFIPVVWADRIGRPNNAARLEVQEFILGPQARQRLLLTEPGSDEEFRTWLAQTYGAAPLADQFTGGARDRERTVNRLVEALARDTAANGFAVLDAKGALMGVELFHDHALMLAFAPRLLRGYLLEAGEDGIRVAPPRVAGRSREAVEAFLQGLPGRSLRVERELLEDPGKGYAGAPAGLGRVTLVGGGGHVAGHGLVVDGTPVHLTLFGSFER